MSLNNLSENVENEIRSDQWYTCTRSDNPPDIDGTREPSANETINLIYVVYVGEYGPRGSGVVMFNYLLWKDNEGRMSREMRIQFANEGGRVPGAGGWDPSWGRAIVNGSMKEAEPPEGAGEEYPNSDVGRLVSWGGASGGRKKRRIRRKSKRRKSSRRRKTLHRKRRSKRRSRRR